MDRFKRNKADFNFSPEEMASNEPSSSSMNLARPPPTAIPRALRFDSPGTNHMKFASPRMQALINSQFADFISPSKEGEVPMDFSPCAKSPSSLTVFQSSNNTTVSQMLAANQIAQDQNFSLSMTAQTQASTFPTQELFHQNEQPVVRTNACSEPISLVGNSAPASDHRDKKGDMDPDFVFKMSPGSPNCEKGFAVSSRNLFELSLSKEETSAEKIGVRRWRSQEMRKHFLDMSNTPPSSFSTRRSLFKRPVDLDDAETPVKRPRDPSGSLAGKGTSPSTSDEDSAKDQPESSSLSDENCDRIKSAVDAFQHKEHLVADGSRNYFLPMVPGKHSDLKCIESSTLAALLLGKYMGCYDHLSIIDCRYPYEYNGGHIAGATNIYTEPDMVEFLNWEVQATKKGSRKHILIFHCEFSSQRGPNLLRHLRKLDRSYNLQHYPKLTFPEVYCLFGGYKDFFAAFPELCEPQAYVTMNDEKFAKELRHFRCKARTWAAGEPFRRK